MTEPMVSDLLSCGFNESPLGNSDLDKQVYSYHVYCGFVNSTGDPTNRYSCQVDDDLVIDSKENDVKRLKVCLVELVFDQMNQTGGFITEFGALSNFTQSEYEIDWITGLSDQFLRSWTYWQFKYYQDPTTAASPPTTESFYSPSGKLQSRKVKALSRTYTHALCGTPKLMQFNPDNSQFNLVYTHGDCGSQPTIIYLNQEFYYPNGFTVNVYPQSINMEYKQTELNYLQFIPRNDVSPGTEIEIVITRN